MSKTSSNFRISNFRNRVVTCLLLTILSFSFLPSVSLAQQPTATIKTLSGNVLVSGQAVTDRIVLSVGDTIQTEARASVVLELSDGSEILLSENTQITLTDLAQTSTGARVSRVKLLWGRIRAFLSSQHQIEGSSFDIETPNALVGVKFSEPDIEVSYNLEKAETVGIAHTVELLAKNLLTDEEKTIPVGSMAIITALGIKVMAGTTATGAIAAETTGTGATAAGTAAATTTAGIGTGTMIAIGAGAVAAAGGIAAIAASSGDGNGGDGNGDSSGNGCGTFTGTFVHDCFSEWNNKIPEVTHCEDILTLQQNGTAITGTYVTNVTEVFSIGTCYLRYSNPLTGRVLAANTAELTVLLGTFTRTCDWGHFSENPQEGFGPFTVELKNCGSSLVGGYEYIRQ